ncbi:MAG: UbiD family decarboxylase [Myxococcota bacterium]
MSYRSLRECVVDLQHHGHLVRIDHPVDPDLEIAAVQRRVYAAGGPALLFDNVPGSPFPAVCNLFGTLPRCRFLFARTLERVQRAIELKADPTAALRDPLRFAGAPFAGLQSLPKRVRTGPALRHQTSIGQLPAIRAWPRDGGPFVTLPQVFTLPPQSDRIMQSNVGMYRVQLSGNDYVPDREVGLHYQIHRGIGVHHTAAAERGEPLRVSVFVGGPPAHTFAAVMPLPEGLSELVFGGMLAGRRFRYAHHDGHVISTDADFVITGTIDPTQTKPEGPFGDHLGYYSEVHPFPVLRVDAVHHRADAIWPFTVVGRPPQEDTTFGAMIHELTKPMVPVSIAGLHAMHAVDAAGVHPLLLALGAERYVPWGERIPRELWTIANAILGFSQASLAKVLMIAAREDAPGLSVDDVGAFFEHVLCRFDPTRDLHFQTKTTMDTLDYSGTGINAGSKLVIAAAGPPVRTLATETPRVRWPDTITDARLAMPGVLVVQAPPHADDPDAAQALAEHLGASGQLSASDTPVPMIVVVDDAAMAARTTDNFLWVTFTRVNPSHDVHGVGASIEHKHWGCRGALVLDARQKAHHAAPLDEDPEVVRRIEALAVSGGPLHGLW